MNPYHQDNSNAPWNTIADFSRPKKANKETAVIFAVIVVSVVFFVVLGILLFQKILPNRTGSFSQSAEEPLSAAPFVPEGAAEPEIIIEPPAFPADEPAAPAMPTEGISSVGTSVRDVIFTPSGQVYSLEELIDGEWVYWVYEYDGDDMFLYRYRNIGTVESKLGPNVIPGTDTTYSDTFVEVNNCVGFTMEYAVTEVYAGDGLGERTLCLHSYGSWLEEQVFDYPRYETFYYSFRFDRPVSFNGFGTPRVHPDSSMFMTHQVLTDVLIADYDYVYLP